MNNMKAEYQAALGHFSFRLLEQLLPEPGNLLISAPSVFLALAMTMAGAAKKTYTGMQAALGLADLSEAEIKQSSQALLELLDQAGEGAGLAIASSLWLGTTFDLNTEFAQACKEYFMALVSILDFTQAGAASKINQWVQEATADKINGIIDNIPPDAVLYLINAVHFQAEWQYPFDQSLTRKRIFNGPAGEMTTPFMHSSLDAGYIDTGGVKGVVLSYRGAVFSFFALLPPAGQTVRTWLAGLDWPDLVALLAEREYGGVELALPSFAAQSEISLVSQLTRLGMADAFSSAADFSHLSLSGRLGLRITEVKHKAFCRIDETGTEAAAATSVQMIRMSLPFKLKEAVFDRPFLYGILQEEIGLPLFLGLLESPKG